MTPLLILTAALAAPPAPSNQLCPAAKNLPQLTIDQVHDSVVPVTDTWQVFWGGVPLSDAQVAQLGGDDVLIDRTRVEMEDRGTWVFVGMGVAAAGTAVSSTGWVLYGQNEISQGITIPMAAGGILLGILGVLIVTESIQTPLEPHLAPSPVHRLTRDEIRDLVARINTRLYHDICRAAEEAGADAPPTPLPPRRPEAIP
jgi:hypothetical protein